ncbi:unnamed protein product [Blepharisma stoltei]|uniref:EF-hand domain-containing protein n=1 Tax=Blepharisma stoltei TaxID=1481888 RepID=A0AAU9IN09_9CILI|nr:unnamed protein product [Blepharisma stoltei]
MLDSRLEIQLCSLIMKIVEGERSVEYLRNRLCDYPDFNPYKAFENLSFRDSGVLIPRDFKDYLGDKSAKFSDNDFYLLVRQYSSGLNGRLNREDFFQLVLPSTNSISRDIALSRRLFYRETFSYEVSLKLLIEKELTLQRELENIKADLYREPGYTVRKAFLALDKAEKGYIREADIIDFTRRFGHYLSQSDMDCFLRRVDTQDDGLVTFEEFLDVLLPLHSSNLGASALSKSYQNFGKSNGSPEKPYENLSKSYENFNRPSPKQEESHQEPEIPKKKEEEPIKFNGESEDKVEQGGDSSDQDKRLELNEEDLDNLEEEKEDLLSPENQILSPKFNQKELTVGDLQNMQNYETPEKESENVQREAEPKKLYSETSIENEVSNFLILQLLCERRIEYYRQNLAMMKEFSLPKFFELIDKSGQGEILISDMDEFLKDLGVDPTNDDLWILFKRFGNKDIVMKLSLDAIKDIINPKAEEYQFMTAEKEDWSFSEECLRKIVELFAVIFDTERKIEDKRNELNSLPDADIGMRFNAIDADGDGEINDNDLMAALDRVGIQTTSFDRKLLLARYSNSLERNISLEDFSKEVLPIIPNDEDAF